MTEIEVTMKVPLSVELGAQWFAALNDDEQARFFVAVAAIAKTWKDSAGQWWYLGGHLRNCECATEDAREMLREIVRNMETSTHGFVAPNAGIKRRRVALSA